MRTGIVILSASLLLAGCGDSKRQQSTSADIAFDTRQQTRSGPVGRSEITTIDAALDDAAEMPAESAMLPPAAPAGGASGETTKPASPTPAQEAPAAAPVPAPAAPSVS